MKHHPSIGAMTALFTALLASLSLIGCPLLLPPANIFFQAYEGDEPGAVLGPFSFVGYDNIEYTIANATDDLLLSITRIEANEWLAISNGNLIVQETLSSDTVDEDTLFLITVTARAPTGDGSAVAASSNVEIMILDGVRPPQTPQ